MSFSRHSTTAVVLCFTLLPMLVTVIGATNTSTQATTTTRTSPTTNSQTSTTTTRTTTTTTKTTTTTTTTTNTTSQGTVPTSSTLPTTTTTPTTTNTTSQGTVPTSSTLPTTTTKTTSTKETSTQASSGPTQAHSDTPTTPASSNNPTSTTGVTTNPSSTVITSSTTKSTNKPNASAAPPNTGTAAPMESSTTTVSTTPVDYCQNATCKNKAHCISGADNYTCNCTSGWTGWHCDQDVDDCKSTPCKNNGSCTDLGNTIFNCSCAIGWTGETCEQGEYCHNASCKNGASCVSGANNYTCVCSKGWMGAYCEEDVDDCESKPCKNEGNCTDAGTNKFNCSCGEGWLGNTCEIDVNNQCETNPCDNLGFCQNTEGNYTCYCNDKSIGLSCKVPDFCSSNPCKGDEECSNVKNVTYDCRCREGYAYRFADGDCEEILLFSFGTPVTEEKEIYGPYFAEGGLPYFGQSYTAFYVNRNGYITLDRYSNQKKPILHVSDWPADVKLIAPLWSYWNVSSHGARMYISNYSRHQPYDTDMLDKFQKVVQNQTKINFTAEFAFAVTWRDVIPYPAEEYNGFQNVSFQCIIMTDGVRSYAIFSVDDIELQNNTGLVMSSGYSTGNGAVITSTVVPAESNRQVYELFNSSLPSKPSDNYKCLNQLAKLPAISRGTQLSNTCPCSVNQVHLDMRYNFNETEGCAVERFGEVNLKAKCCYDKSLGTLLVNSKLAGYLQSANINITEAISATHDVCCGQQSTVCGVFYNKYPSDTCRNYKKLKTVQYWGSPASKQADGSTYIFNGLGEYFLIGNDKTSDIWMSGNFTQLSDNANVTVLSAITLQVYMFNQFMEAKLNLNQNTVDFSFDKDNDKEQVQSGNMTDTFSIVGNTIIFPKGVYIEVKGGIQLLVTVYVPENLSGALSTGLISVLNTQPINQTAVDATKIKDKSEEPVSIPLFYSNFSMFRDMISNSDFINQSEPVCKKDIACLMAFVPHVTNKSEVVTKRELIQRNSEILNLNPPMFVNDQDIWKVVLAEGKYSQIIETKENASVYLTTDENPSLYSFDATTGNFIWNLTSSLKSTEKKFTFIATDSNGENATFSPWIILCSCSEKAQCDYHVVNYVQPRSSGKFLHAVCRCSDDKTGEFCETKRKSCDECFPGASCNESRTDNPCTCPSGLEGNGINCYDKNDCLGNVCGENAVCENLIGNHSCSCFTGYEFNSENKCVDIDECKRKSDPCPGYVDELRQLCVNTMGGCSVSCRPTFRGEKCLKKVEYVYGGNLVFAEVSGKGQLWTDALKYRNSDKFKEMALKVETAVTDVLNKTFKTKIIVSVTKFTLITSQGSRRRRAVSSTPAISANFQIGMDKQASTTQLNDALVKGYSCDPQNKSCSLGSGSDSLIGVSKKSTSLNGNIDLCTTEDNNCHHASTTCVSSNGTFTCECKTGFQEWSLQNNACEDIDECSGNWTALCGERSTSCTNHPGSYTCLCQTGYTWTDAQTKCQLTDHCRSGPCQNSASCVNTPGEEPGYACKCSYGWTGATCSDKDDESERRRIIIVAVSASLGGLCFILLVALCCICRRKKDSKSRSKEDSILDDAGATRIPRPQVRRDTDNVEMVENHGSKTNLYRPLEEENALKQRQESNNYTKFERHPKPEREGYTNLAYDETTTTSGATGEYDHL